MPGAAGTGAYLDAASVQGFALTAGACVHPSAWSRAPTSSSSPRPVSTCSLQPIFSRSCKALLENGFTQDDGKGGRVGVPMSLGALDEPHHTSCYRLFNLSREAAAHHYTAGPAQPALGPAWEDLRAQAAALSASAPP